MSDRSAIINLSSEGYGVVRKINDVAVTVPSKAGLIVMSNECYSQFLKNLFPDGYHALY